MQYKQRGFGLGLFSIALASDAQVALAITGFVGPGAPDDEPGLAHFACARDGYEIA